MNGPWSAIAKCSRARSRLEMIKGLNLKGNLLEELIQKKLVLQEAHSLWTYGDRRRSRVEYYPSAGISGGRPF